MDTNFDILPLSDWLCPDNDLCIIGGPCSAETYEQVMNTARALSQIPQVKVFRAGIWRPDRTEMATTS
jgi:chorismate mutase